MRNDPAVALSVQYPRAAGAVALACAHIAGRPGLSFGTGAAGVDAVFVVEGFMM